VSHLAPAGMSYSSPLAAYLAFMGLAFVLAEFVLPDLWPWYRDRMAFLAPLVYALPLAAAPSAERLVGLLVLGLALGLGRLPEVYAPAAARRGLGVLLRFASAGLRGLAVLTFVLLTSGAWPTFPNPEVAGLGPLARVVTWAAVYIFMLAGGTALVRWVLDDFAPHLAGLNLPEAPPRRAGFSSEAAFSAGQAAAAAVSRDAALIQPAAGETAAAADGASAPAGAPPGGDARSSLSPVSLNLGRIIGNLERLIILTLVTQGQYAAIGIVLAAKSIVRYERLIRSRDFADYYLIGTLMSITVALAGGILLLALDRVLG